MDKLDQAAADPMSDTTRIAVFILFACVSLRDLFDCGCCLEKPHRRRKLSQKKRFAKIRWKSDITMWMFVLNE